YANRSPQSSAYVQRLEQLAQELPTLTIKRYYDIPVPEQGISPEQVNAALIDQELINKQARFYICGPKGRMDALTQGLINRVVPNFGTFTEAFISSTGISGDHAGPFEVCFARSESVKVQWRAAHGTLLDLGEPNVLSVPSGCRVGQC